MYQMLNEADETYCIVRLGFMTQMVHYLRLIRRGIFMTLDGALYAYSLLFVVENISLIRTL